MKKAITAVVVLFGIIAFSLPLCAETIVFNYNFEFSGAVSPAGTSPWLKATFEDAGSGKVRLTFEASGLVGTEYVGESSFNFNPLLDLAKLNISAITGVTVNAQTGLDAFKADGDGYFDILFDYPQAEAFRFGAGDKAEYLIELTGGSLTPEDFKYKSVNSATGYYVAAHVQSIGTGGQGSGWVTGDPSTGVLVPEPGTMLLLGIGLLGLGITSRKRS
ncbi:MAG: PEP-CTERM sorting domain-containing protein [Smithella sp.]